MNIKKDRAVGIIPIDISSYKYLLIKHQKGHWGFPKGHQESGEFFIETAIREIFEETGIKKEDIEIFKDILFYDEYQFKLNNELIKKEVFYFLGFLDDKLDIKIQKTEVSEYKWTSYDEAMNLFIFEETKNLFLKVNAYLQRELIWNSGN